MRRSTRISIRWTTSGFHGKCAHRAWIVAGRGVDHGTLTFTKSRRRMNCNRKQALDKVERRRTLHPRGPPGTQVDTRGPESGHRGWQKPVPFPQNAVFSAGGPSRPGPGQNNGLCPVNHVPRMTADPDPMNRHRNRNRYRNRSLHFRP